MTYKTATFKGIEIEQTGASLTDAIQQAKKDCEHDHKSRVIYDAHTGDKLAEVRINFNNKHARGIRLN